MEFEDLFEEEKSRFLEEARESIEKLLREVDPEAITTALRAFHTLKGSSALLGFEKLQKLFHELEDIFRNMQKEEKVSYETLYRILRVIDFLEGIKGEIDYENLNHVRKILEGEEVEEKRKFEKMRFSKEFLENLIMKLGIIEIRLQDEEREEALRELRLLKNQLIRILEEIQYIDLEKVLKGFETMIKVDAERQGKKVEVILDVGGVRIEKEDANSLKNILVHLVRNAVAHGIESPEDRKRVGKREVGRITIKSWMEGDRIHVIVEDDGRGMDMKEIEKKMKELGIEGRPEDAIFSPGFTTSETADEVSGRGVGLYAVKEFVDQKGGEIFLTNKPGKGVSFHFYFPIERILKKVLILRRKGAIFGLNLEDVETTMKKDERVGDFLMEEKKVYEVIDIGEGDFNYLVLTKFKEAIAVDEILGIREVPVSMEPIRVKGVKYFIKNVWPIPIPVISPKDLGV